MFRKFWELCPSGWHLPSSTGTSSYTTLVQNYVGRVGRIGQWNGENRHYDTSLLFLSFTRSGDYEYSDGSLAGQSSRGLYWSRTHNGTATADYHSFRPQELGQRTPMPHGTGLSLRCLVH